MQNFIDTHENIHCRECGRTFKQITTAHLDSHGMRTNDYQIKYPDAPIFSQKTLDIRYEKQGGDKHPWIGRHHTQETKDKLKEYQLENNFIRGKHLSDEHRNRISIALTGITRSEVTKDKLRKFRLGYIRSLEDRRKQSITQKEMYKKNPELFYIQPAKPGKNHFNFGKQSFHIKKYPYLKMDGQMIYLRSTWELAVAEFLDKNKYKWEYEFTRYILDTVTYCPDFFVFNSNQELDYIIEVKGWMTGKSIIQIEQFKKLNPSIKFFVWNKDLLLNKGIYVK